MRLDRGSTLPRRLAVAAVLVVWAGAAAADVGSAVSGGTAMVNWQSWNNTCPSLVPIWSPDPPEQHARCRHTCHGVHCTLRVQTSARRTLWPLQRMFASLQPVSRDLTDVGYGSFSMNLQASCAAIRSCPA